VTGGIAVPDGDQHQDTRTAPDIPSDAVAAAPVAGGAPMSRLVGKLERLVVGRLPATLVQRGQQAG
jgi:hypothetical protein